jgi:hypothetical protein
MVPVRQEGILYRTIVRSSRIERGKFAIALREPELGMEEG